MGQEQIIMGLERAIKQMAVGEVADVIVPSLYAYGASGLPPHIPPHATLRFEVELLEYGNTMDLALDRLQALHTILCYMCSINAHHLDVTLFLYHHPQALLLEGVNEDPEESALFIVMEQMQKCKCRSLTCNNNREKIIYVLHQGFDFFQNNYDYMEDIFGYNLKEIQEIEQEIRKLRLEQRMLKNGLADARDVVQQSEMKLAELHQPIRHVARLSCGKHHKRAAIEYEASVANIRVSSLEREHRQILREIREFRRQQYFILKASGSSIRRHYCTVSLAHHKQAV